MTSLQKPTYDVATPLDVDYLDAFGEATDEDRAHWDRARAYAVSYTHLTLPTKA